MNASSTSPIIETATVRLDAEIVRYHHTCTASGLADVDGVRTVEVGTAEAKGIAIGPQLLPNITTAAGGEPAIEALHRETMDAVITDLRMPKVDGLQVLRAAKEISPDTAVIMITAVASTETAVEAMKHGALDYVMKDAGMLTPADYESARHAQVARRQQLADAACGCHPIGKPRIVVDQPVERVLHDGKGGRCLHDLSERH